MNKETLAKMLDGRSYGNEMTDTEENLAKNAGLVVVFGYSDDNAELRGAINDEIGCYDGGVFKVAKHGVVLVPDRDEEEVLKRFGVLDQVKSTGREIEAVWDDGEYSWTYKTEIPHATFDIVEEDTKFCRGIVFSVDDLEVKP